MRAVVTGGAGFIGSHLVDGLLATGTEVLVIDDLSSGSEANLDGALRSGAMLACADVRDGQTVTRLVTRFRPDLIFHLAAQVDIRVSVDEPSADASVNVLGTVNVLNAAAAAGVRNVVNTSTGGAIYGETDIVPTPETVTPNPLSPYGLSKHTAERYCSWFRTARGLNCVTLRYENVYGPRQDAARGAVIARFCDLALRGERPDVYGDGRQTRDFVHVSDIVAANLAAASTTAIHDRYNIGTGIEVSVLDLVATIQQCADLGPGAFMPRFQPARDGEVHRSCLAVDLGRAELRLPPPMSLDVGVRTTLDWLRSSRPTAQVTP